MRDPLGQSSEQSSRQSFETGAGKYPGRCSDKNSGKLMAWLDRELPDAEAAAVERHVRACTECASRAEAYRQTSMAFEAYCEVCCEAALAALGASQACNSVGAAAAREAAGGRVRRARARNSSQHRERKSPARISALGAGMDGRRFGGAGGHVLLVVWPRGRVDRPASPASAAR